MVENNCWSVSELIGGLSYDTDGDSPKIYMNERAGIQAMNSQLISLFFKTKAIRLCPRKSHFLPQKNRLYYITPFSFWKRRRANLLLKRIDTLKRE